LNATRQEIDAFGEDVHKKNREISELDLQYQHSRARNWKRKLQR